MNTLTLKQQRFVDAYTGPAAGNATQAARIAGYKGNDNVLAVQGHMNLRNRKVAAAIAEATKPEKIAGVMSREECLTVLSEIARDKKTKAGDRINATQVMLKFQTPPAAVPEAPTPLRPDEMPIPTHVSTDALEEALEEFQ